MEEELKIKPDEILQAIDQVREEKLEASDYTFLEDIHPAPSKKGNDGLANWISLLAIYEEDGQLVVDEELVEYADQKMAEEHGVEERNRISNIVYDSENRPGSKQSLLDNEVNGHQRLEEMVEEFYKNARSSEDLEQIYKDGGSLPECDNMVNRSVPEDAEELEVSGYNEGEGQPVKPEDNYKGGENEMSKFEDMRDVVDYVNDEAEREIDGAVDAVEYILDEYGEAIDDLTDVADETVDTAAYVEQKGGQIVAILNNNLDLEMYKDRADDLSEDRDKAMNRMGF